MDRIDIAKVLLEHRYNVAKSSLKLLDYSEMESNWRAIFQGDTVYVVLFEYEMAQIVVYKVSLSDGYCYVHTELEGILGDD